SPLSFGRFWQTPEGLDKNTFSVSGNVFFRLSWTSEYAMQHVAWKSPASGGIGSILFASPLISSGGNLGLCDLASGDRAHHRSVRRETVPVFFFCNWTTPDSPREFQHGYSGWTLQNRGP